MSEPIVSTEPVTTPLPRRAKKTDKEKDVPKVANVAAGIIAMMKKRATSSVYTLGDMAKHTWGIEIPDLALQWLIGHSSIVPCQRYFRVSGMPKSLKSTFMIYLGGLYVQQGGVLVYCDNEGKTSASMLDAMTWWWLRPEQRDSLIPQITTSAEQWMTIVTDIGKGARDPDGDYHGNAKGQRIPILIVIDSLMGREGEDAQELLQKEGSVEVRGYATLAGQITRFLDRFTMAGTTLSMGYVQHMKPGIDGNMHEKGAVQAGFSSSVGIRVTKFQTPVSYASHALFTDVKPDAKGKTPEVTGFELLMATDMSCLGPDKNKLVVEVLWQHVPVIDPVTGLPDGTTRQVMKYDWAGALGRLLHGFKYDDKAKLYEYELNRLNETLYFVQGKSSKTVKCEALGLENATFTEFGLAIQADPVTYTKVQNFLNIKRYDSVQQADIDWSAGSMAK